MPVNDTVALGQMYPQTTLSELLTFPITKKKKKIISLQNSLHKEHSKQVI